ncbi:hypothetical protein A2U01_0115972, partial [Trifolium medium]|nr:hypothetical protein [Trifolium medium]
MRLVVLTPDILHMSLVLQQSHSLSLKMPSQVSLPGVLLVVEGNRSLCQ